MLGNLVGCGERAAHAAGATGGVIPTFGPWRVVVVVEQRLKMLGRLGLGVPGGGDRLAESRPAAARIRMPSRITFCGGPDAVPHPDVDVVLTISLIVLGGFVAEVSECRFERMLPASVHHILSWTVPPYPHLHPLSNTSFRTIQNKQN